MRAVETNVGKTGKKTYKVRYRHAGKEASQTFDRHTDAKRFATLLDVFKKDPQLALDQMYDEAPYFPGMRVAEGTQIRLPGGALFQVLSIRRDEEGHPGVLSLTLEPISDDA